MQETENFDMDLVNCRIGSLESVVVKVSISKDVNCRIGSLEKFRSSNMQGHLVNCRIGSLENFFRQ